MRPFWKKLKPVEISEPAPAAEQQPPLKSEPQPEPSIEVPKKPEPNRKRSEMLRLRLTEEELNYLTEQAKTANMSRTDYIMTSARNRPAVDQEMLMALLRELRKQGVNLNQLTKLANQTGSTELSSIEETLDNCEKAENAVMELIEQIKNQ